MRRDRPVRKPNGRRIAAFLLVLTPWGVAAQNLELPELVLPGRSRVDIVQPDAVPDVTAPWIARLPNHRRIYPLAVESVMPYPDIRNRPGPLSRRSSPASNPGSLRSVLTLMDRRADNGNVIPDSKVENFDA